jgi:hypothetical protein
MVDQKLQVFLTLVLVVRFAAACQPMPVPVTKDKSTAVPIIVVASPIIVATPTAQAVVTSTVVPVSAEEEDCMGECHFPDPNASFAAGAMPQPASHVGRTACLTCHSTQTDPVLPTTHVRLDPSCIMCHTESAAAK